MKFRTIHHLVIAWLIIGTTSCKDNLSMVDYSNGPQTESISHDKISIKLKSEYAAQINNNSNTLTLPTGCSELDSYLRQIGSSHITRIFPYAGKDEDRQRMAGLNLWYTVYIDKNPTSISRAMAMTTTTDVATYVEPVYHPQLESYTITRVDSKVKKTDTRATTGFNDPLYIRQWDFKNDGTIGNYVDAKGQQIISSMKGADINIEPAWKITTGSPNVVVAVTDGGVDLSHPDLQGSLWCNEGEIPGNGIDDDNNGYVDDYYGYNFVDDTCAIEPTRHGTHVAGTIAARNNNGLGVCGIAGGNGNPDTGVKIMCCQIFKDNPDYDENDPNSSETIGTGDRNLDAAAIVYSANNGAIISQNSWGFGQMYHFTPQVIKEAIAYFNENAGGEHTKKPVMKGGVVIFAAGNDGTDSPQYPAAEENVISVAAFNPDYEASWYTNYGETVDLAAPGGTQTVYSKYPEENGSPTSAILSTVPRNAEGRYGYAYMQGTSMACPHVSGIAALIASHFGGPDFTAAELRQRLLSSVKGMDYNEYVSHTYHDGMGLGYVDALMALTDYNQNIKPETPVFISDSIRQGYGSVSISWKSKNQGSDGSLQYYRLYYSTSPITLSNYQQAASHRINANYAVADQIFTRTNSRALSNTTYYFAVQAVARNGKASEVAILDHGISTLKNHPPVITTNVENKRITLAGNDQADVIFHVYDPDGHKCSYSLTNGSQLSVSHTGDDIKVHINASKYIPGIYPFKLTVKDEYNAETTLNFVVEIIADHIPSVKSSTPRVHLAVGQTTVVNLLQYIDDEKPEALQLTVTPSTNLTLHQEGKNVTLKGTSWGEGYIKVEATDEHGQTGKFQIPVFVYTNPGIYALYPTIATSTIYLRVGDDIEGQCTVSIRNAAGKRVRKLSFNTTNLDAQKRTWLIDISQLTSGSYTLTLSHKNQSYEEKFIKE